VKIWKFKLEKDFKIDLKKYSILAKDCVFYDTIEDKKIKVGYFKKGVLCIYKDYEWDGCTPKFKLFGKIVGIPDFGGTYNASLVHDFLIEFFNQHSLKRKEIDFIFEYVLKDDSFQFTWIYSNAVHLFRKVTLELGSS
jgi:hypothetical protein